MPTAIDWWSTFFEGAALDSLRGMFSPEHTRAEADFLQKFLRLEPGSRVLDVPCGFGRLSLELAGRGHDLTGVDLCGEAVEEARASAAGRGLEIAFEHRDMRDLPWEGSFDAAFCLGGSFAYLDDEGNAEFLKAAGRALKPGGRFAVDASTAADNLLPSLVDQSWHALGDYYLLRQARYEPREGRLHVEYRFIRDGKVETKEASYRTYTYRQIVDLLEAAGFEEIEGYGGLSGEPFTVTGSGFRTFRQLLFVARKRG
jgi:SAM-dependent methyltransferase